MSTQTRVFDWRARSALFSLSALVLSTALTVLPAPPASADHDQPAFEVPFPCGEVWQGATRGYHGTDRNTHFPLDFNQGTGAQDRGASVVASATGTVIRADHYPNGLVEIDHGNGWTTLYLHLETLAVQAGARVVSGDQVGTLGDRGSWGQYHLHYEQLLNGKPQHIAFRHEPVEYDFVYTGGDYVSESCRPTLRGHDIVTEGEFAQWLYRLAATTDTVPAVGDLEAEDVPSAAQRAVTALADAGLDAYVDDVDMDLGVNHARFREVMRSFTRNYGHNAEDGDYVTLPELEGDSEAPVTREAAAAELHQWAGAPEMPHEDVPPYVDMPSGEARHVAQWLHDTAISRDFFPDMPVGSDVYGEAQWMSDHAAQARWQWEFDEDGFAPGETVTRHEAASVLAQVATSAQAQAEAQARAEAPEQAQATIAPEAGDTPALGVSEERPNATITRAELAVALYKLVEEPVLHVRRPSIYEDVPLEMPEEEAIQWLAIEGIAAPSAGPAFRPHAAVTREDLALLLYRFASYLEERSEG
ncbi:MAG: peptidoglycan DD-metalloendopeptidase family protein [Demequina sp.]